MEKPKYPSDEAAKFMLRLPVEMREQIAQVAKASGRSMNAEIVARLQLSFEEGRDAERYIEQAKRLAIQMEKMMATVEILVGRRERRERKETK